MTESSSIDGIQYTSVELAHLAAGWMARGAMRYQVDGIGAMCINSMPRPIFPRDGSTS